MTTTYSRRRLLAAGASLFATATCAADGARRDQAALQLAFTETGPAAEAYKKFAAAIKDSYDFEPYWGNTLFKQGAELVALQRGNLEMCNLAPADISKQIPAWSLHDLGVPVPRCRSPEENVQERHREGLHQDGARSARHPGHHARLFRLAQHQPEARQADPDTSRSWPESSCGCRPGNTGSSWANPSA